MRFPLVLSLVKIRKGEKKREIFADVRKSDYFCSGIDKMCKKNHLCIGNL